MKPPLVFAHRGASFDAPENTLTAFRLGMEQGADGIELDVRLTADGELAVFHDDNLDRTTDGTGPVSAHTLWELQQFDAGRWKAERFEGEGIPTLDEVFEALPGVLVNVELKSHSVRADGLEEKVLACIRRHGAAGNILISSFNPLALARMRALDPALPLAMVFGPDLSLPLRRAWLRQLARPAALHPHHTMVTPHHMAWAQGHGLRVNAWTVDDPAEMRRLIALDVDGMFTNVPAVLRDILRAEETRSEEPMDE